MNDVAAVVVTYNRLTLLKQCVEHLLKQSVPCDILIVDNASTDGTNEWISTLDDARITYLRLKENTGGAGGFHYGMKHAVEQNYSFVWVMDDDTLPEPFALERLLEADTLLEGNYGFLSSVVLWTDRTECRMNKPKAYKKGSFAFSADLLSGIQQASFVSCLLRSSIIYQCGLPIREFFIWGDDIEYTRRLAVRKKLPCYLVKKSVVIHAMAHNNGSNIAIDSPERISRYFYAFRNENYLYRKEGIWGFMYYTAKCCKNLVRILFCSPNKRFSRCWIIVKCYFSGLLFNPPIEIERGEHHA